MSSCQGTICYNYTTMLRIIGIFLYFALLIMPLMIAFMLYDAITGTKKKQMEKILKEKRGFGPLSH